VVERAGVLPRGQVRQSEVVAGEPLKGAEVERALEAGNRGDVFLGGGGGTWGGGWVDGWVAGWVHG